MIWERIRLRTRELMIFAQLGALLLVLFLAWQRRVVLIRNRTPGTIQLTVSLGGKDPTNLKIDSGVQRTAAIFAIPARGEEFGIAMTGRDRFNRPFALECGYESVSLSRNYFVVLNESASGDIEIAECDPFDFLGQWFYIR